MRIPGWTMVVALILFAVAAGAAEEAPAAPVPTAEHKELGKFVGTWAGKGELQPGPFGPGGPMTWTENCSWFGGSKFHVVCESEGKGPMGPMQGLGIMGYDTEKKVYTHYGVDNSGWSGLSEGTRSGEGWTFHSRETMGGQTYQSRFTMKMESPQRLVFRWEMSEDGENWTTMMDGTSQKK